MANDDSLPAPGSTVIQPASGKPTQVIIQQSMFGWFGKALLAVVAILVMVIIGLVANYRAYFNDPERPQERYHSLARHATQKIAIITLEGTITTGDGFVKHQIDAVKDDTDVVAVVLRINSPGGTVTGSDYLYHYLRQMLDEREIPLVVSMGSLCASGGYYVAMAVGDETDALYAEPMTITGSIGVIMPHFDLSGLLDRWDVKDDSIATGPLKEMGSFTKPMTEADRQALEAILNDMFAGFKEVVAAGRPKFKADPAALDAVATGQVFTAKQALDRGLIDKIGFLEVVIERAAELAGVSTDDVRCVQYERPRTFVSELIGAKSHAFGADARWDVASLLDLTAPRAYYLWTILPIVTPGNQDL